MKQTKKLNVYIRTKLKKQRTGDKDIHNQTKKRRGYTLPIQWEIMFQNINEKIQHKLHEGRYFHLFHSQIYPQYLELCWHIAPKLLWINDQKNSFNFLRYFRIKNQFASTNIICIQYSRKEVLRVWSVDTWKS